MRQFKPKKVNKKLCLVHSVNSNFKQKWTLIVTALYSVVLASQIALGKIVKSKWNEACRLHCIGCGLWTLKETTLSIFLDPPRFWAVGGVRKCCPWALGSGGCSPLAGTGRLTSLLWVCVAGIMYRKSCASSAACLIASAGYQSFCSPGKLNSVCISCCNTPLCNGPRPKKRSSSAMALRPWLPSTILLLKIALFLAHCWRRKEMSVPPALFFWPALPPAPRDSSGCPFILGREGNCSFSSFGNKERAQCKKKKKKKIFVSSEYIELEFSVCP